MVLNVTINDSQLKNFFIHLERSKDPVSNKSSQLIRNTAKLNVSGRRWRGLLENSIIMIPSQNGQGQVLATAPYAILFETEFRGFAPPSELLSAWADFRVLEGKMKPFLAERIKKKGTKVDYSEGASNPKGPAARFMSKAVKTLTPQKAEEFVRQELQKITEVN